jgi:hypothetical protein
MTPVAAAASATSTNPHGSKLSTVVSSSTVYMVFSSWLTHSNCSRFVSRCFSILILWFSHLFWSYDSHISYRVVLSFQILFMSLSVIYFCQKHLFLLRLCVLSCFLIFILWFAYLTSRSLKIWGFCLCGLFFLSFLVYRIQTVCTLVFATNTCFACFEVQN